MCGEGPVEKCSLFDDDPEYDPSVWDSDDDSCYGEGDPPDMLLFLHQNRHAYRRQDALDALPGVLQYCMEQFRAELEKYPLETAIRRHEWMIESLGFQTAKDLVLWAKADGERWQWALEQRRGFVHG